MPYKPKTVREEGLANHLGKDAYAEFVFHYNYWLQTYGKINIGALARAIHKSRPTTYNYVRIYRDELAEDS